MNGSRAVLEKDGKEKGLVGAQGWGCTAIAADLKLMLQSETFSDGLLILSTFIRHLLIAVRANHGVAFGTFCIKQTGVLRGNYHPVGISGCRYLQNELWQMKWYRKTFNFLNSFHQKSLLFLSPHSQAKYKEEEGGVERTPYSNKKFLAVTVLLGSFPHNISNFRTIFAGYCGSFKVVLPCML